MELQCSGGVKMHRVVIELDDSSLFYSLEWVLEFPIALTKLLLLAHLLGMNSLRLPQC